MLTASLQRENTAAPSKTGFGCVCVCKNVTPEQSNLVAGASLLQFSVAEVSKIPKTLHCLFLSYSVRCLNSQVIKKGYKGKKLKSKAVELYNKL